ncbi:MAG TPA: RsmB/NOP family class I SAM-dependent RNA methyltransferase [Candidatus Aenigmarchaeota archaeon]|nr:RsmB/NOP family class I SAM-dependent RNA methyltransferase [Candidatus Aenigmarchaeota archaeon]
MIPSKLGERLEKLGLSESIYEQRTRKCILSRTDMEMEKVPWYESAYFLPDDFHKKDSFVFDPVSLVPCLALDAKKEDKILDICAAPGTKTFIISFLTRNEAYIIANDISRLRVKRLKGIVNKYDLSAEVLNMSGRKIAGSFNKIILDAPCSGEGMVNKNKKLFDHWSEKRIRMIAKKQKKLIAHAFELLEWGGTLVYSTCTFSTEENEGVVDFLLSKYKDAKLADIDVNIVHTQGLIDWDGKKYDNSLAKCFRIYPQHNNTSGFFVAKISKGE